MSAIPVHVTVSVGIGERQVTHSASSTFTPSFASTRSHEQQLADHITAIFRAIDEAKRILPPKDHHP